MEHYSDAAVNIPVKLLVHDIGNSTLHVFADSLQDAEAPLRGISTYTGSIEKAKKKLKPQIANQIAEALRDQQHAHEQDYFGCSDGTILRVHFRNGSWGYDIAGAGREHVCGAYGYNTREEAREHAQSHAEQAYGGIAWRN